MTQINRKNKNTEYDKKLNIVILFLLLLCFLSIGFGVAFFTKSTTATNIISFGDVKIKLHETYIENNQEFVVDTGKQEDILKVSNSERNIKIENVGSNPAFIRVSLDMFEETNIERVKASDALTAITTECEDWIYSDGWYYYKQALEPGFETEAITTTISFNIDKITSSHKDSLFDLDIVAQAVQSENNCDNVLDIVGWPEEQEV